MMKIKIIIILLMFSTVVLRAKGISYNQEFEINKIGLNPCIATLIDGSYVVFWEKFSYDNPRHAIYGQLFDDNHFKMGDEFQVSIDTLYSQLNPSASSLDDGQFVVCWQSIDNSGYGIFGQIFNNDGSKHGSEFQVNTYYNDNQDKPTIDGLQNGGFIVCWRSCGQVSEYYSGIYGQLFKNDGSYLGSEFQINSSTIYFQDEPSVIGLSTDGFVVCWESRDKDINSIGIYSQIFDENGSKHGDEFRVNTSMDVILTYPRVSTLTDEAFVISWVSGKGKFDDIYHADIARVNFQLYNNDGTSRGNEFHVDPNFFNYSGGPSICSLINGGFIVCWPSLYLIYGQIFNNDGSRLGTKFLVSADVDAQYFNPAVNYLKDNGFVVCWNSAWLTIFGKYYLNEINHSLTNFSLLAPLDDITLYNISPELLWTQASLTRINLPWELEYKLYLDEDESFLTPTIIDSIYDTTYTVQNLTPGTTYFWKVLGKNIAGDSLWSRETNVFFISHDATSIQYPVSDNPKAFELYANYPNPFNPETTIEYNLPADKAVYSVKVKIYDALGRLITTLKNVQENPGIHSVKWNGKNSAGQNMPSGIYFCVVEAGQFKETKKMLLIR